MRSRNLTFLLAVVFVLACFQICEAQSGHKHAKQSKDIVDTAVSAGQFKTLAQALKAAGLVETLKGKGPFTVFAPTDEAFKKLPKGTVEELLKPENKEKLIAILTYHVVPGRIMARRVAEMREAETVQGGKVNIDAKGRRVRIGDAAVTATNIECSNGVIHVIDTVIMPKDIIETAVAAGKFRTLAKALKAAALIKTLKGKGPFTVFAPTDEAFEELPPGTLENLLKPENKAKLIEILTYHVVPGKIMAKDVVKLTDAKTVQGSELSIRSAYGKVMIDDAVVVTPDIVCGNGVVHVINKVMLPK